MNPSLTNILWMIILALSCTLWANWGECKRIWESFNDWACNHKVLFGLLCWGSVVLVVWGLS